MWFLRSYVRVLYYTGFQFMPCLRLDLNFKLMFVFLLFLGRDQKESVYRKKKRLNVCERFVCSHHICRLPKNVISKGFFLFCFCFVLSFFFSCTLTDLMVQCAQKQSSWKMHFETSFYSAENSLFWHLYKHGEKTSWSIVKDRIGVHLLWKINVL